MVAGRIDRQSDNLHVSALKLWFYPSHVAELGRADRGEVLRMREQDGPRIADPIVESYAAFGCFCFKIRCGLANSHNSFPFPLVGEDQIQEQKSTILVER